MFTDQIPDLVGRNTPLAEAGLPILRHQDRDLYFREHTDRIGIGSPGHFPLEAFAAALRGNFGTGTRHGPVLGTRVGTRHIKLQMPTGFHRPGACVVEIEIRVGSRCCATEGQSRERECEPTKR